MTNKIASGLVGLVLVLVFALVGGLAGIAYTNLTLGCNPSLNYPLGSPGCSARYTPAIYYWILGGAIVGIVVDVLTSRPRRITIRMRVRR